MNGLSNSHRNKVSQLPKLLQVFVDTREVITENVPFFIITFDEYSEFNQRSIVNTPYLDMTDQMKDSLKKKGLDVTTTNIFDHLLSDIVLLKVCKYTTEQMACNGHPTTTLNRYKQFLGTMWLMSRIHLST